MTLNLRPLYISFMYRNTQTHKSSSILLSRDTLSVAYSLKVRARSVFHLLFSLLWYYFPQTSFKEAK
jgi:hypothetical protein